VDGAKYFSVKYAVKILNMRFIPIVCYKLDSAVEPTIRAMVEVGDAKLYTEKVRFLNGAAIPVKVKESVKAEVEPAQPKPGRKKAFN